MKSISGCATGLLVVACLAGQGCGGYDQAAAPSSPTAPAPTPAANTFTVDIAEINGPWSFYPIPAIAHSGQAIVWRNTHTVTHRIVLDNGSVDTGTLAPGTSSQPIRIGPGEWSYHCTIHPEMTGKVTVVSEAVARMEAGVRPVP